MSHLNPKIVANRIDPIIPNRTEGLLPQISANQPQMNPPKKLPKKKAKLKYPVLHPVLKSEA